MKAPTTLLFALVTACGTDVNVLDGTDGGDAATSRSDAWLDAHVGLDAASRFDAERPSDSGPPLPDGSTPDYYYRLVRGDVDIEVTPESCETVGKRFDVVVHWFSSCHEPGPVQIDVNDATREVVVAAWLWELVGPSDCRRIEASTQRTAFARSLTGGSYHVTWARGAADIAVIDLPAPIDCAPGPLGAACVADCQCSSWEHPYVQCVDERNDAACSPRTCQSLCNVWEDTTAFQPECPGGLACLPDPVYGRTCQSPAADLCRDASDCPAGMRCDVGDFGQYCTWDFDLGGSVRHECSSNADCGEGLDCVEDRSAGGRACQVRCRTNEQPCPRMHECTFGGTPLSPAWVCEWIGE